MDLDHPCDQRLDQARTHSCIHVIPGMAIQANLQQEMMRPEVVEDVKQNMDTYDTRDEVLDVSQLQRELRNSYAGDGQSGLQITGLFCSNRYRIICVFFLSVGGSSSSVSARKNSC